MFNNRYKKILLITCLLASGCTKFVEVDKPIDTITAEAAFATETKAASVVRGLYNNMVKTSNFAFGAAVSAGLGASADELIVSSTTSAYAELYNNNINTSNTAITNYYWGAFYNLIYVANQVIENVPKSTGISEGAKIQFLAEARFVRAVNYFYLINLYGDVPLILGTDYVTNTKMLRTPMVQVYKQMEEDLQYARTNLGESYMGTQRIRANRFAASAFLARVYLYQKNWKDAELMATEVIEAKEGGTPLYRLETTLNNVFLLTSKEVILQLMNPGTTISTWDGAAFVPGSATSVPNYQITPGLYNAFPAGDLRLSNWIRSVNITTAGVITTYRHPYKYKVISGTATVKTEALVFLRLAEMYLIRAEARTENSDLSNAISDLDVIRSRAGLLTPTDPAITQSDLLDAIARERRLEMFAELGHRWLDLKRTDKANIILKDKPNWTTEDQLYPIPFADIQANPLIKQNLGYGL
ncbi:SusD family protein [Chitinophaga sp. CF118]|uniref:RagB/SusD family nutrient uptake outer membrane protein n=1 Tax=Chitinophaga sp. CF118 TaxID=1884367 RepID=UPI0008EF5E40|nr:RagB/SusD family nutrient uptake outer membrane protein [Chitinophaga sp. CF118]SFE09539.1 SusD family protein [Chitinophaga sp. CF118]